MIYHATLRRSGTPTCTTFCGLVGTHKHPHLNIYEDERGNEFRVTEYKKLITCEACRKELDK